MSRSHFQAPYSDFNALQNNPIRHWKKFPNTQENAIIGNVTLYNYYNNRNVIFIDAINKITAITLDKKINADQTPLSIKKYALLPGYISIKIKNYADLEAFRQLIESVEHMPPEWYNDIFNTYSAFIHDQVENTKTHTSSDIRDLTNDERALYEAIDQCDLEIIKTLLKNGMPLNSTPTYKPSPLVNAVWNCIEDEHTLHFPKSRWHTIIKLLLDYGADVTAKDLCGNSTLSIASTHHDVALTDLLLKYEKKVEFTPCAKEDAPHRETIEKLNEHFSRITFFSKLAKKDQHIKTEVELVSPNTGDAFLAKTKVKRDDVNLEVETYLTTKLTSIDLEQLFKLYQNNFSDKNESTPELQRKHFNEKLGISRPEQVYIDVIKSGNNIVGFNLYKCYQGRFADKPYHVIYCSLAYIDKPFRGTRIMSLLSFRGAFALKEAYPDIETYIFYDAIHPNSYRQAWNLLPRYPECRVDASLNFIKHVTTQIYSEQRANQYDGKSTLFWPTDARVESSPIKLTEYDLPCVIEKFDEITHGHQGVPGKGGIPVMIPVISLHFQQMTQDIDHKLNNTLFAEHVNQFSKIAFKQNHPHCNWNDSTECLWPNNLIMSQRLQYAL